jgi:copper chaperone NosL
MSGKRLHRNERLLVALGSLILATVFFVPMWRIDLVAPQYPEGLGLYIWMTDITGQGPHELNKINRLNHYIGMKEIVPAEVPELWIMPLALGVIILIGFLAAASARRSLLALFLGSFILFGVVGLADFYRWGYDYGHTLNPEAPIKVPGMSYQPPVIGTKKILNFVARSMPTTGSWIAAVAFLLAAGAFLSSTRRAST